MFGYKLAVDFAFCGVGDCFGLYVQILQASCRVWTVRAWVRFIVGGFAILGVGLVC